VVEGLIVGGPRRDRIVEAGNDVSEGPGHLIAGYVDVWRRRTERCEGTRRRAEGKDMLGPCMDADAAMRIELQVSRCGMWGVDSAMCTGVSGERQRDGPGTLCNGSK